MKREHNLPPVARLLSTVESENVKRLIGAARGGGQPLAESVQRTLEASFGLDLSAVRVHTGSIASTLAHALGAEAFTCGADIFYAADAYRPESRAGIWLLAHEITHVVQQARRVVVGDLHTTDGMIIGQPDDLWESEANAVATRVVEGRSVHIAAGMESVAAASLIGCAGHPMIIQCHDSFEHRVLGDVSTSDLYAVAAHGSQRAEVLNREIQLLWLWHQNPEAVTESQLKQLCPWLNTLRLGGSGLLVTYGELNALPDYIATPGSVDTIPKGVLLPILQFIRQEGYIQLNKLLNRTVSDPFQYAVYSPSQWYPSLINKLLESQALDQLTQGLGIKGVDHYSGLLARNACHFAPYSWYRWQSSYLIARDLAQRAYTTSDPNERARLTYQASIYNGYADHFLQDSFAAGHLVNKTLIMQWFIEWAATQSLVPVADWDFVKYITTPLQPGLAGRQLYNPSYDGLSNDPQTSEDQPTYAQRLQTTGLVPLAGSLDTAYQDYLTFLSSLITQSSSAAIHDYYNSNSLWVGSVQHPEAYEIWGDATLLSGSNGGNGTQFTSEAAQLSQKSIRDLLATGRTDVTTQQLRDRFPTTVRNSTNQMISLEAWNDTQRDFCRSNIFPGLHDIIVRMVSPRISNLSQDQDLAVRWSTSLPDCGFNITSILNDNNRVFAGSNGYVYELAPSNGAVLQKLLVTGSVGVGNYETRLATNGQTLFVGVHGYVYGIALNNWSHVAWEASLPNSGYTVVDVLSSNNRLFAASNGYVYELNPGNGQVVHSLLLGSVLGTGDYTSSLATDGQLLFIGTHGYVYGVNLNNWSGAAWSASLPRAGYTLVDVLSSNSRLFAGSNGYLYELQPNNGQLLHSLLVTDSLGVGDYTTRLATNGQLLFAGVHGYVYGVNLSNWSGSAWSADLAGNRYTNANVVSFNNQLLAGSYGSIYRINPTTGQVIRSVLLASSIGVGNYETRIATSDGEVMFAGAHGYGYGVSLQPSPLPTPVVDIPAPTGSLTSLVLVGNSPRVYYVDVSTSIHELWYNNGSNLWYNRNVAAESNAPVAAATGLPSCCFVNGNSPRVYYVGLDTHIHELWYDNGGNHWYTRDVGAESGAPTPSAAGIISSLIVNGNSPRVYYAGSDTHVHELWYDNGGNRWYTRDVSAESGAPGVRGSLSSFAVNGNSPRVYYLGSDSHIHELWYDNGGNRWYTRDLTAESTALDASAESAVTCCGVNGNSPRVYHMTSDNHVTELWYDNGGNHWYVRDLTAESSAPPIAANGSLSSCLVGGNSPRVYYLGADSHIHELWYDNGGNRWYTRDVGAESGPPVADTGTIVGSLIVNGNSPRVYHLGSDDHIHELWYNNSNNAWYNRDLTGSQLSQ